MIDNSHSLTCPASGIPLPDITWYKSNQPIKENTTEYLLLNDGWTLKILSVTEHDSARFTCRAKNIVGQSEKAFDLNVLGMYYTSKLKTWNTKHIIALNMIVDK